MAHCVWFDRDPNLDDNKFNLICHFLPFLQNCPISVPSPCVLSILNPFSGGRSGFFTERTLDLLVRFLHGSVLADFFRSFGFFPFHTSIPSRRDAHSVVDESEADCPPCVSLVRATRHFESPPLHDDRRCKMDGLVCRFLCNSRSF